MTESMRALHEAADTAQANWEAAIDVLYQSGVSYRDMRDQAKAEEDARDTTTSVLYEATQDLQRAAYDYAQLPTRAKYDCLMSCARAAAATDEPDALTVLMDTCTAACYALEAQPASEAATNQEYAYMEVMRWIRELRVEATTHD